MGRGGGREGTDEEDEEDEIEYETIKIKKRYYYVDNESPPKVYKTTSGGDLGKFMGHYINDAIEKVKK